MPVKKYPYFTYAEAEDHNEYKVKYNISALARCLYIFREVRWSSFQVIPVLDKHSVEAPGIASTTDKVKANVKPFKSL